MPQDHGFAVNIGGAEFGHPGKNGYFSPDFYPTLLNAAGVEFADRQSVDGEDLRPLLTQSGDLSRDAIFWHYPHYGDQGGTPGSSIRMGDWKLTERHEDGALQLFNLREDIGEAQNRAETETDLRGGLHNRLRIWQQQVEALFPLPCEPGSLH